MRLYLVQHGRAKPRDEDPARPLSEEGRAEVEGVAHRLAPVGLRVEEVWHSGKARAEGTARVLVGALWPGAEVRSRPGLAPNDPPGPLRDELERMAAAGGKGQGFVIVGHLPFLAGLASLLLTGDADGEPVAFRNGGVVCLESSADAGWALVWAVVPELVR